MSAQHVCAYVCLSVFVSLSLSVFACLFASRESGRQSRPGGLDKVPRVQAARRQKRLGGLDKVPGDLGNRCKNASLHWEKQVPGSPGDEL